MNKVSFIITTGKLLLQLFILLIHYITRTPLIVIYYGMACYGLFGSPSQTTSYCFYLCFSLFLINLLLVILFNSQKTKQKCIDLVGKEYYEEYMSHSQAAAKSLLRLGSGLLYPCGVELVTSAHSYYNFHSTTDKIRGDLKYHLNFINNKEQGIAPNGCTFTTTFKYHYSQL